MISFLKRNPKDRSRHLFTRHLLGARGAATGAKDGPPQVRQVRHDSNQAGNNKKPDDPGHQYEGDGTAEHDHQRRPKVEANSASDILGNGADSGKAGWASSAEKTRDGRSSDIEKRGRISR